MNLGQISQFCYDLTSSYLQIKNETQVITETQDAIRLTRQYLLNDTFSRWSPLNSEISFSYNGGKDCQVLLLLYLSCLWEFFLLHVNSSQYEAEYHAFPLKKLPTVFIDQEETFSTLEQFVKDTSKRYCLSLYEPIRDEDKSANMADAFREFLKVHPETKSIVIGIRHTDPFAENLKPIQRTDPEWPDFVRLQPLLHWKLTHIWSFLLYSGEPICGLYNVGFTSIGSIRDTLPNPHLKINDGKPLNLNFRWEIEHSYGKFGKCADHSVKTSDLSKSDTELLAKLGERYLPGWYLVDDSLERAGRIKNKS